MSERKDDTAMLLAALMILAMVASPSRFFRGAPRGELTSRNLEIGAAHAGRGMRTSSVCDGPSAACGRVLEARLHCWPSAHRLAWSSEKTV
jgi:hypothetical protein